MTGRQVPFWATTRVVGCEAEARLSAAANDSPTRELSGSEVPGAKVEHASVAERIPAFRPAVVLGAVVMAVEQLHAIAATAVSANPIRLTGTG